MRISKPGPGKGNSAGGGGLANRGEVVQLVSY